MAASVLISLDEVARDVYSGRHKRSAFDTRYVTFLTSELAPAAGATGDAQASLIYQQRMPRWKHHDSCSTAVPLDFAWLQQRPSGHVDGAQAEDEALAQRREVEVAAANVHVRVEVGPLPPFFSPSCFSLPQMGKCTYVIVQLTRCSDTAPLCCPHPNQLYSLYISPITMILPVCALQLMRSMKNTLMRQTQDALKLLGAQQQVMGVQGIKAVPDAAARKAARATAAEGAGEDRRGLVEGACIHDEGIPATWEALHDELKQLDLEGVEVRVLC